MALFLWCEIHEVGKNSSKTIEKINNNYEGQQREHVLRIEINYDYTV